MSKEIAIIDYGSGNLHSIAKAVEKVSSPLGFATKLVKQGKDIKSASHVILPGVGAFADCLEGLKSCSGMIDAITEHTIEREQPFLGICIGMHLLATEGLENGAYQGLNWIKGTVKPIPQSEKSIKIPHMGWNSLVIKKKHSIIHSMVGDEHMYFVHSYFFDCEEQESIVATTWHGQEIPAIIQKDNIIAVQFHPEKSHNKGLEIIKNFVTI